MAFSKLIVVIIRIEKKMAVNDDKISKSKMSEPDFENSPLGGLCNRAVFSIIAGAL